MESIEDAVLAVLQLPCMRRRAPNCRRAGQKRAVVFDIDDTLLHLTRTGKEVPIDPVLLLYRECLARDIEPLVVTARSYSNERAAKMPSHVLSPEEHVREIYALFERLHLPRPHHLALRHEQADDFTAEGIAATKGDSRRWLASRSGCKIIGTVGDRWWDHSRYPSRIAEKCQRDYGYGGGAKTFIKNKHTPCAISRGCYVGVGRAGNFLLKLPEAD